MSVSVCHICDICNYARHLQWPETCKLVWAATTKKSATEPYFAPKPSTGFRRLNFSASKLNFPPRYDILVFVVGRFGIETDYCQNVIADGNLPWPGRNTRRVQKKAIGRNGGKIAESRKSCLYSRVMSQRVNSVEWNRVEWKANMGFTDACFQVAEPFKLSTGRLICIDCSCPRDWNITNAFISTNRAVCPTHPHSITLNRAFLVFRKNLHREFWI